jgi:hypothetical protein
MKTTQRKKLTLSRESLRRLEGRDLAQAKGGANTDKCTAISCMYGCGNYTKFGTCTC